MKKILSLLILVVSVNTVIVSGEDTSVSLGSDFTTLYSGDYEGDRDDEQETEVLSLDETLMSSPWLTERGHPR